MEEEKRMIVNELPSVQTRKVQGEDGSYHLVTRDEALQEILEKVEEIKKATVGK